MTSGATWEHAGKGAVRALVAHPHGVACLRAGSLAVLDDAGRVLDEQPCSATALGVARIDGVWWTASGEASLARVGKGRPLRFAEDQGAVRTVFASEEAVVVVREGGVELWSHGGKRKWSAAIADARAVAFAGTTLAVLDGEGVLRFLSLAKGEAKADLRLASTEPVASFRLARVSPTHVVLALGDWLVLVDAQSAKVEKRIRVEAKVTALAADAEFVAAGLEDGAVQIVQISSGEQRLRLAAHPRPISGVVLARNALYTSAVEGAVRSWPRRGFEAGGRARAPITAMASRGTLVAAGDRSGRVRILDAGKELATVPLGTAVTAIHVTREDAVVCVTAKIVVRIDKPWRSPMPIALRAPGTAFASDDVYAFVGTEHGNVDVYDLGKGEHVTSYELSEAPITAIARLPNEGLVVGTASIDGRVFVVDVSASKVLHRIDAHDDAFGVTCLSTDARGRIVASGSDDGSVALLDPAKGRVLARLRVKETPQAIAFESTGRRFGCAFADGTAALVTLGKPAVVEDLGLEGASHVAWGHGPVFGLKDGRVEPV